MALPILDHRASDSGIVTNVHIIHISVGSVDAWDGAVADDELIGGVLQLTVFVCPEPRPPSDVSDR